MLIRSLVAEGKAYGAIIGMPVRDFESYSPKELEISANNIINEEFSAENIIDKILYSYDLVNLDNINGIKILLGITSVLQSTTYFHIHELNAIPYVKNHDKNHAITLVYLHCSYGGLSKDKDLIIKYFNAEYNEICQKFNNSLDILDK
jgi:hypothetical protein